MGQLTSQASRLFRRLADKRLEPLGMSAGQLPILTALMDVTALSQKALVERAALEQPTMAATLNRMERDGIIVRQPDAHDRRSSLFSLTAEARGKIDAVREIVESMNADAVPELSGEQVDQIRKSLAAMIEALSRTLEEES